MPFLNLADMQSNQFEKMFGIVGSEKKQVKDLSFSEKCYLAAKRLVPIDQLPQNEWVNVIYLK